MVAMRKMSNFDATSSVISGKSHEFVDDGQPIIVLGGLNFKYRIIKIRQLDFHLKYSFENIHLF